MTVIRFVFAAMLAGAFALVGGTPHVRATLSEETSGGTTHLAFVQMDAKTGMPIRQYDEEMSKLAHLIIVRDDLQTFAHVHPAFDARSGAFTTTIPADPKHRYYAYIDTRPHDLSQQVFRFTLNRSASPAARPTFTPSPSIAQAGPYRVQLASTTLAAQKPSPLEVHIERDGHEASDLRPYLGAPAHVVFINAATLAYAHVHPTLFGSTMDMDMSGMAHMDEKPQAGSHLTIHVPALPAGTYRMWLQFASSDGHVYVAPYSVVLR